jgi:hypothetical protein
VAIESDALPEAESTDKTLCPLCLCGESNSCENKRGLPRRLNNNCCLALLVNNVADRQVEPNQLVIISIPPGIGLFLVMSWFGYR